MTARPAVFLMDTMTNATPLSPLPPLPMDAAPLLPQKPPMRLVTRLLAASASSGGEALAECVLEASSPFADGQGNINPVAFIEMAAQTCAAAQGYADTGRPAREGFLVGVRDFTCAGTAGAGAKTGEVLHVRIRPVAELDGFILVDAAVSRPQGTGPLASLRVKVYLPPMEHS